MNSVNLVGRLTRDPEVRYSSENTAIANFSIAVNRNYKNANGEYEADFINCTAFRNTAEFIQKYFTKGQMIGVSGKIQTRKWVGDDGKNNYSTSVIVESTTFTESKKNSNHNDSYEPNNTDNSFTPLSDEDLPF